MEIIQISDVLDKATAEDTCDNCGTHIVRSGAPIDGTRGFIVNAVVSCSEDDTTTNKKASVCRDCNQKLQ